jgi:lipopolysaccharide export system protein LptA
MLKHFLSLLFFFVFLNAIFAQENASKNRLEMIIGTVSEKNAIMENNRKSPNKKLGTPLHMQQTADTDAGQSASPQSHNPRVANMPVSPVDTAGRNFKKRFEIVYAGFAESYKVENETVRFVKKDESSQVCFRYEGDLLFCDSAYQYVEDNFMSAFGRVLVMQGDSMMIESDSLFYDGFKRLAQFRGNVVVRDGARTVYTKNLDYNTQTKVAYYFGGGSVRDKSSVLRSDYGYYYGATKMASFKGNVAVNSEDANLTADTLTYNSSDKKVYFNSLTKIAMKDGNYIETYGGFYDTVLGKTKVEGKNGEQSRIENRDYAISGDDLDFDNVTNKGIAKGNVELFLKKDKMTIFGQHLNQNAATNEMTVHGRGLMIRPYGRDTLYLSADTIIAVNDSIGKRQVLLAYPNAKVYKSDLQSVCDSLTYDMLDSVIYFQRNPVIWSDKNQLTAHEITVRMKNNNIDTLKMYLNAFIASLDEYKNYNQIKGKNIYAIFREDGYSDRIKVDGNAESIFYIINEEKRRTSGLNNAVCSSIDIFFADSNQISHVIFNKDVDGKLIPMHEVNEQNKNLNGFKLRTDERPTIESVMDGRVISNDKKRERKDPATGLALKTDEEEKVEFDIRLEENHIVYYKKDLKESDIKHGFFLQITPVNPVDLPETQRSVGIAFYGFNFTPDDMLGDNTVRKKLPDYPIKKIVTGQEEKGKGILWKKVIQSSGK